MEMQSFSFQRSASDLSLHICRTQCYCPYNHSASSLVPHTVEVRTNTPSRPPSPDPTLTSRNQRTPYAIAIQNYHLCNGQLICFRSLWHRQEHSPSCPPSTGEADPGGLGTNRPWSGPGNWFWWCGWPKGTCRPHQVCHHRQNLPHMRHRQCSLFGRSNEWEWFNRMLWMLEVRGSWFKIGEMFLKNLSDGEIER